MATAVLNQVGSSAGSLELRADGKDADGHLRQQMSGVRVLLVEVLGRVIEEVDEGLLYVCALLDLVAALPSLNVHDRDASTKLPKVLQHRTQFMPQLNDECLDGYPRHRIGHVLR